MTGTTVDLRQRVDRKESLILTMHIYTVMYCFTWPGQWPRRPWWCPRTGAGPLSRCARPCDPRLPRRKAAGPPSPSGWVPRRRPGRWARPGSPAPIGPRRPLRVAGPAGRGCERGYAASACGSGISIPWKRLQRWAAPASAEGASGRGSWLRPLCSGSLRGEGCSRAGTPPRNVSVTNPKVKGMGGGAVRHLNHPIVREVHLHIIDSV